MLTLFLHPTGPAMRMDLDLNQGGILSSMDPMLRNFETSTFIFVTAEKKEKTWHLTKNTQAFQETISQI